MEKQVVIAEMLAVADNTGVAVVVEAAVHRNLHTAVAAEVEVGGHHMIAVTQHRTLVAVEL